MSIKLRFFLLLGVLSLALIGSLGVLHLLEKKQLAEALSLSRNDTSAMLERLLKLSGTNLRQFTEDYSRWDDLVRFMQSRDAGWADVNLRQSLANFNACSAWVLGNDGTVIYQAHLDNANPLKLGEPTWLPAAGTPPFPHFFVRHGHDLVELRAAPIQPTDDLSRHTPPKGWLVAARLWDQDHLNELGALTESRFHWGATEAVADDALNEATLTVARPMSDANGHTLAWLQVTREVPAIAQRLRTDVFEARVFVVFGLLVLGALSLSLYLWILRPLATISESLTRQNASPLQPLIRQNSELSHIARQLEVSFAQQLELQQEVQQRARLGRDLHDGVIQSIYAAGMGLSAARTLIPTNPDEAARNIDQVRAALNETIRDVRNFINRLEPETTPRSTFTMAAAKVFEFFSHTGPTQVHLEIDEAVAERLHLLARADALQIIRECASNAIRHGHARNVWVSLQLDAPQRAARLTIRDDGRGFDPLTVPRGRGLNNIAERARHLGTTAEITSSPEKGTRTTILFSLSEFPA
jgi:signal transduction histidine kinase